MLFNGVKIQNLKLAFFGLALISSVYAEDFGIALPDQLQESEYDKSPTREELKKFKDSGAHVMGIVPEADLETKYQENKNEKSYNIPEQGISEVPEPSEREKLVSPDNPMPFKHENLENMVEIKNDGIYGNYYDQGESSFSFTYIKDSYSVTDDRNIYQSSYIDSNEGLQGGFLLFNFDNYISRNFLSPFYGVGLGVGFSRGEGIFETSTDTASGVTFQLFMIPLDFRLGVTVGHGKYVRFSLAGGPSVMGLSQSRDDRGSSDEDKHRRQVSYGYFGHGKMQVSLNSIFNRLAFKAFQQYKMTNMYLNLEARYHNYANFQDEDIAMDGASFGIGFTFEYL